MMAAWSACSAAPVTEKASTWTSATASSSSSRTARSSTAESTSTTSTPGTSSGRSQPVASASYDPGVLIDGAELDAPAAPLNQLLRPGLEAGPDEVAVVSVERSLTWSDLDRAAYSLAGGYRTM